MDSELKLVVGEGWPYIKGSGGFITKLKNIDPIAQDAIMISAIMISEDVIGLYPSILHDAGLEALKKAFDTFVSKKASTDDKYAFVWTLMMSSLFGLMVKKSSDHFWKI